MKVFTYHNYGDIPSTYGFFTANPKRELDVTELNGAIHWDFDVTPKYNKVHHLFARFHGLWLTPKGLGTYRYGKQGPSVVRWVKSSTPKRSMLTVDATRLYVTSWYTRGDKVP